MNTVASGGATAPTSVTDDSATALVAINDAATTLTTALMTSPWFALHRTSTRMNAITRKVAAT